MQMNEKNLDLVLNGLMMIEDEATRWDFFSKPFIRRLKLLKFGHDENLQLIQ